jgi:hypothetical protein
MGRCRAVQPQTVRLPLSDGDFVDVRGELNAGEYVEMLRAVAERRPFARILTYVLGWSFVGVNNTPIPYDPDDAETVRLASITCLDIPTLREVNNALNAHEEAVETAFTAKKKPTPMTTPPLSPGTPASSPTFASVA